MLKLTFWALLCLNGVLLAYGQGYLGNFKGGEREPARLQNQLNGGKLTLVPAPAPAAQASAVPALPVPELLACIEIGTFSAAEGRRFEARLAALELGERQRRQNVAAQEITSHIVHIPSLGNKEAAERKAEELKSLGVANYFIMSDNSPMKWAISLGVFKSEAAAQTLLAALGKKGVRGARIAGRGPQTTRLAYQFRGIDAGIKERLDQIAAAFPSRQTRSCK